MKVALPALGVALLAVACGGPGLAAKRVAFTLPDGFTKAESEDGKIALGIPGGWRAGVDRMLDSSGFGGGPMTGMGETPSVAPEGAPDGQPPSDAQASIQALTDSMQKISNEDEERELAALAKKGVILHAIGGAKPIVGEERTRFYVKKTEEGGNWNWESAERTERDRFLHKPKWAEVDLQVGKVHMAEESRQQIDGSNKTLIVYLVIDGPTLYSVRFVTQEAPETVKLIARPVMDTFRVQ